MKSISKNDQVTASETATILQIAERCLAEPGDFVELGCYRGDTSVLLGRLLQNASHSVNSYDSAPAVPHPTALPASKRLWIYDSFAGLPAKTAADYSGAGANFQAGELLVTKREVVEKIRRAGLKNVIIKKAWFSDLTAGDLPGQIAFGFLDGDLYESIKVSLQLVAPRLIERGIIIVHDYNNPELPGSSRAVDEFLRAHSEYKLQVQHTLAILQKPPAA